MTERKGGKGGGPGGCVLACFSPRALLSRISDPATIFIAVIAAIL